MKVVVQRSKYSKVTIDNKINGEISKGYVLLTGFTFGDTKEIVDKMIDKIINLRIFEDENEKMNLSLLDINGSILNISQFTLYADAKKGRRPSFINALTPNEASDLYDYMNDKLKELNITLPYITNNGANMFLGDTCIYECPIDSSELKTCLNILVTNKVAFLAYTNQTIYSVGSQDGLDEFKNRLIGKCKIVENANIEDIVSESIFMVVMIHPNMEKIKNQLN